MRIAILAHNSRAAGGMSVGKNLLAAIGRQAGENEYLVTIPAGYGYEDVCRSIPHCRTLTYEHTGGPLRQMLFETFRLPRLLELFGPDVIYGLGNRGLLRPPCPQAIYVQDAHLCYPRRFYGRITLKQALKYRCQRLLLGRQLRRTRLLLCQTPIMERRLRKTYGFTGEVALCPSSVPALVLESPSAGPVPPALAPYAGKTKLLCLAAYYGHKNLETIVEVFDRYRRRCADVVCVLTLSAGQHLGAAKLLRTIERKKLSGAIVNVGPLAQSELGSYYRACQAMFLPTFLESLSGTYAEAMHFGLPILTSDLDFARALCGEAALYFDPWNARSVADAIVRFKNDPHLRQELGAAGKARLEQSFQTWDEIAAAAIARVAALASTDEAANNRWNTRG